MRIIKGNFKIKKGMPVQLGASQYFDGVNFAVDISHSEECLLNIYTKTGTLSGVVSLDKSDKTGSIFSVFVEDFDITKHEYTYEFMGNEFIDPYSKKISGRDRWGKPFDKRKKGIVRSVVVDKSFDWEDDINPRIAYEDAIFYKAHLRGFTKHSSSKVKNPGTFEGFIEKIPYLKELGITSVIFLPIYDFDEIIYDKYIMCPEEISFINYKDFYENQKKQEDPVAKHYEINIGKKGIVPFKINYWGYGVENSFYFAPKTSYAADKKNSCQEFKRLVKELHKEGIECILEFNFKHGIGKQFVYECFRYWMLEYHVDGFKFNANAINGEFVAADPLLAGCKLICEGWNEGQIYNNVPPLNRNLAMMNDDYMINLRKYLKGDEEQSGDFAYKFRRNPINVGMINYLTNANGFTMNDLFSFDIKHNEDNFENGVDGTDYNYSWNCGIEGKTRKNKVIALRKKQIKNAFTLLLLSQGSPMILAGDEFLNSQNGNNNAYCQDNEITWLNWHLNVTAKENLEFVKKIIEFRKEHNILHQAKEMRVMDYVSLGCPDMSYHGTRAWYPEFSMYSRTLGIMLYGKYAGNKPDSSFYIAINMHWEDHEFDIPRLPDDEAWECILDCSQVNTSQTKLDEKNDNNKYLVKARNVAVFEAKPKLITKKNNSKDKKIKNKKKN